PLSPAKLTMSASVMVRPSDSHSWPTSTSSKYRWKGVNDMVALPCIGPADRGCQRRLNPVAAPHDFAHRKSGRFFSMLSPRGWVLWTKEKFCRGSVSLSGDPFAHFVSRRQPHVDVLSHIVAVREDRIGDRGKLANARHRGGSGSPALDRADCAGLYRDGER